MYDNYDDDINKLNSDNLSPDSEDREKDLYNDFEADKEPDSVSPAQNSKAAEAVNANLYGSYDTFQSMNTDNDAEHFRNLRRSYNTGFSSGGAYSSSDNAAQSSRFSAGENPPAAYRSYGSSYSSGTGYSSGGSNIPPSSSAASYRNSGRKRGGAAKRVAALVASAMLFGTVAGGTMVAVNKYAGGNAALTEQSQTAAQASQISKIKLKEPGAGSEAAANAASQGSGNDIEAIAERSMPSVVAINGTTKLKTSGWFGEGQEYEAPSSGSGIIIGQNDSEYLIVTNNHVIDDTSKLSVVFIDGEEVEANIKGGDSDSDIAIIAVKKSDVKQETIDKISIASLGDSDKVKVGQSVVAIGNALGYGQSVTAGIVSALNREVQTQDGVKKSLLQTDAAINPGNSGGALINMDGDVIGINSAKYSSTEVEGMGYAIPVSTVKDIIEELSNQQTKSEKVEEAKQGYLGIQGQNIDSDMSTTYDMPRGVYVYKILEGGAASNSELREKDIITKINSQTIKTMEDLKLQLTYYSGGEKVKLTVQRLEGSQYKEMQIEVTLGFRQDSEMNKEKNK